MTEITRQTVTLINLRDGQERYTRYSLGDVVEMIRKGKLKSGKLIEEQTGRPRICFASAIAPNAPKDSSIAIIRTSARIFFMFFPPRFLIGTRRPPDVLWG